MLLQESSAGNAVCLTPLIPMSGERRICAGGDRRYEKLTLINPIVFMLFFSFQGDNLIFEHQWELEKIQRLTDVERTRHFLLMRDKMGLGNRAAAAAVTTSLERSGPLDKSEKEAVNLVAKAAKAGTKPKDPYEPWDMTPREREVSTKYLRLMTYHVHR